ncbi:MAG TPA: APC family permease, partial [Actinomycetota bacterium]|nr:APC family permease [Actinomycetota bacterium]
MAEAARSQTRPAGHLRREVGPVALLFTSLGSIIGSGWLFGALYAANETGPAAIFAWIIAGVFIIILALNYAEIATMHPISGGIARYPHFSYGTVTSALWGWLNWLGAVAIAPIEVLAVLQYSSNYLEGLTRSPGGTVVLLTPLGYVVATILMALFVAINLLGVKKFAQTNTPVVWFKIIVPTLTALTFLIVAFHGSNFTSAGFAPTGLKGILVAISAAGVFFAMFGFDQAAQLGGESRNPSRNVPLAVIGSALIGTAIYILLQISFIGAIPPSDLSKGWDQLTFAGAAGPYAGLASIVGLSWLAGLLYVDAGLSPGGTGLVYAATSARVSYGLARNGYVPRALAWIDRRGIPVWSFILTFVAGMLVFLPFPAWQRLATFITSAYALVYAIGPLVVRALRTQDPERERPYRLPGANILAPAGFMAATFIVYFAGWLTNYRVFLAVAAGVVVMGLNYAFSRGEDRPPLDWKASLWVWP